MSEYTPRRGDAARPACRVDTRNASRYIARVILSFRHKGLERFFLRGTTSGIPDQHARRIRLILGRLAASMSPRDLSLPGLVLHQLKGARQGTWSVRVTANWRITFRFVGPDACDVNLEDYH